jgi:hypothetical protein
MKVFAWIAIDVFVASLATIPIYAIYLALGMTPLNWSIVLGIGYMWIVSLACGEVLVLPATIVFPAFRRPAPWVATAYGVTIAWISSVALLGFGTYKPWVWLCVVGITGGVAGLSYSMWTRRRLAQR